MDDKEDTYRIVYIYCSISIFNLYTFDKLKYRNTLKNFKKTYLDK